MCGVSTPSSVRMTAVRLCDKHARCGSFPSGAPHHRRSEFGFARTITRFQWRPLTGSGPRIIAWPQEVSRRRGGSSRLSDSPERFLTTALYQTYLRRTGGIQSESLGVDRVNVGVRDAVVSHRDPLEDWLHHFPLGFCCKFLEGPGKSADDLERLGLASCPGSRWRSPISADPRQSRAANGRGTYARTGRLGTSRGRARSVTRVPAGHPRDPWVGWWRRPWLTVPTLNDLVCGSPHLRT